MFVVNGDRCRFVGSTRLVDNAVAPLLRSGK
jgi:hypothetical protein